MKKNLKRLAGLILAVCLAVCLTGAAEEDAGASGESEAEYGREENYRNEQMDIIHRLDNKNTTFLDDDIFNINKTTLDDDIFNFTNYTEMNYGTEPVPQPVPVPEPVPEPVPQAGMEAPGAEPPAAGVAAPPAGPSQTEKKNNSAPKATAKPAQEKKPEAPELEITAEDGILRVNGAGIPENSKVLPDGKGGVRTEPLTALETAGIAEYLEAGTEVFAESEATETEGLAEVIIRSQGGDEKILAVYTDGKVLFMAAEPVKLTVKGRIDAILLSEGAAGSVITLAEGAEAGTLVAAARGLEIINDGRLQRLIFFDEGIRIGGKGTTEIFIQHTEKK